MPSIPQSLLWISLVVLWLFVLVPMLISKRDQVRRTSDVALATRVLNSGAAARLLRRGGPAAGHRSNPDWQPAEDEDDDLDDVASADTETMPQAGAEPGPVAAADDAADVENEAVAEPEPVAEDEPVVEDADEGADPYEYVDDTSGIPVAEESSVAVAQAISRGRRYESDTAAAVSARKYAFRKRVLMVMALALGASSAAAFLLNPGAWWICGSFATVTVLYLGYLRRQTRIEERVQRRRMQRMARSRLGVENAYDREFDVVPSRLRRPGSVVLEIDDEDPIFEHLDYAPYARDYRWHGDLPRAVGQ
jgi:hypothetical protein